MKRFVFNDGTSNKYWEIDLNNCSFTVHYGKIGTTGTKNTKSFNNIEKAEKEYNKTIASKVKKGYVEKIMETTDTEGSKTETITKTVKITTEKKAVMKKTRKAFDYSNPFNLSPYGIYKNYPAWIECPILIPSKSIIELWGLDEIKYADNWDWLDSFWFNNDSVIKKIKLIDLCPFKEIAKLLESQFETAILLGKKENLGRDGTEQLGLQSLDDVEKLMQKVEKINDSRKVVIICLLLGIDTIVTWMLKTGITWSSSLHQELGISLRYLMPLISLEKRQKIKEKVRNVLATQLKLQICNPSVLYCAAAFKVNLLPLAELVDAGVIYFGTEELKELIISLPNLDLILEYREKLAENTVPLSSYPERILLSCFGINAFSCFVKKQSPFNDINHYISILKKAKCPEIAYILFPFRYSDNVSADVWKWFFKNHSTAARGITCYLCENEDFNDRLDWIRMARSLYSRGCKKEIKEILEFQSAEIKNYLTKEIIDYVENKPDTLNSDNTPEWLSKIIESYNNPKESKFVDALLLPELSIPEGKLSIYQTNCILWYLEVQNIFLPNTVGVTLKKHISEKQLDDFVWSLFNLWLYEGHPVDEDWMMMAMGLLGQNSIARKLEPLIRKWPGESQNQRALKGLTILEAIGTDTSLILLNGIANKVKFPAIKREAGVVITSIAKKKGLLPEELDDRLIPDCGLEKDGTHVFDFGSRSFTFSLNKDFKPVIKNQNGKILTTLPKPSNNDDGEAATKALNEWKIIKKQIRDTVKIQTTRLESAMITKRSWSVTDFEKFYINHPLMRHITSRLLWGVIDTNGNLEQLFRVSEELEICDENDNVISLNPKDSVVIIHPLELSENQKKIWGEIFSDYEIVTPFSQISRQTYSPEKEELENEMLLRFDGIEISAPSLVYGLDNAGWRRGVTGDNGSFTEHFKYFYSEDLTSIVSYDGNVCMHYIENNETLTIKKVYFVWGEKISSYYINNKEGKKGVVKLQKVSPRIISEVINDISIVAAKA